MPGLESVGAMKAGGRQFWVGLGVSVFGEDKRWLHRVKVQDLLTLVIIFWTRLYPKPFDESRMHTFLE